MEHSLSRAGLSLFSYETLGLVGRPGAEAHGKTRERTVYTLTDKGLDALREHAPTPCASPRSRATRCCGH